LVVSSPLSERDAEDIAATVKGEAAKSVIQQAAKESRKRATEAFFHTPAEAGESLNVPQLALRIQGELELFDDPSMLVLDWEPSPYDASPTTNDIGALEASRTAEGGVIDVTQGGRVTTEFIANLQRDLGLSYVPEHWDQTRLATWLCRNLPEPTITHAAKRAFVSHWLDELLRQPDIDLARANRQKFLIRDLLESRIRELQQAALDSAYQDSLFGDRPDSHAAVSGDYIFEFPPHGYAPGRYDEDEYGHYRFKKHFYGQVGAFDSKEEFDCACWLDQQAERGRILFWVRNPVRRESCSFFLQKADGRFYPDFVCKLPNGIILVVEYKGADRWDTPRAQKDRAIGELWASLSDGRCRFVMVKEREWSKIETMLD
jgi:type III restriction enzyme